MVDSLYLLEMVLTSCMSVQILISSPMAYLVSLGLGIRLEVAVLDKVVSDLRVVPSAEDGRLGSGVVFIKEFLVLFLLELGSVVGADHQ